MEASARATGVSPSVLLVERLLHFLYELRTEVRRSSFHPTELGVRKPGGWHPSARCPGTPLGKFHVQGALLGQMSRRSFIAESTGHHDLVTGHADLGGSHECLPLGRHLDVAVVY